MTRGRAQEVVCGSLVVKQKLFWYIGVRTENQGVHLGPKIIASVFDSRRERKVYLVHITHIGARLVSEKKIPRNLANVK